jgi:putative ABC transport system permease protein
MINDFRFAFRMIATRPWFSAAVILTLALGIGINTTVFTLVNAVLFKPVPVPGGDRIVTVSHQNPSKPKDFSGISYPDFREYQRQNGTFEGLEAAQYGHAIISEPGNPPERFRMMRISTGLFGLLKIPPVLGRDLSPDDGKAGAPAVALLGHGVWQNRYAGSLDVIGRAVRINGSPATIVGVMPAGFKFPNNEDLWMALSPDEELEKRSNRGLTLFGLHRSDQTVATANADLAVIGSRLAKQFPDTNKDLVPLVRTFHDTFNGDEIRLVFLMMLGAVCFVLLIACANVANMMLSRAITRAREIAVRAAMGATRWQIVRQLLVESVLLSTLGGLLGLGLSAAGVHAFDLATRDVGKPYWVLFEMDFVVFAYFAAISILSGVVFGLVPALRASRVDLNSTLKDGTVSGGSIRGGKLTGALVVLQFALTVVLLAAAGMMMRGFFAAQSLNPFVRAESIFTARIQLPEAKGEHYAEPLTRRQFYDNLLPRLSALPGVTQAAAATHLPGMGSNTRDIEIEGKPASNPEQPARASFIVQTAGYLPAIGLPILAGRGFEETDGDAGKESAVVTRAFAARYWPNEQAMGKRFRFVEKDKPVVWINVVGISADIVQNAQEIDSPPLLFIPYRQEPWGWMGLLVRTASDPVSLAAPVRAAVQAIDQDLPLFDARAFPAALERQRWFLTVFGTLFLIFALTGLLMASVGIYAVVAQSTSRRTREIGIRMALGATGTAIMKLVLSRGLRQLALGVVLGLGGAFAATRLMQKAGFLIQVSPNDPFVFVSITLLLVIIGVLACWLPAKRAARIAPTDALRTE